MGGAYFASLLVVTTVLACPQIAHAENEVDDFDAKITGSARLRVDSYDNPSFGLTVAEDFASWQYRATATLDVTHKSGIAASFEVGYYDEEGRSPGPRNLDQNRGELLLADISYTRTIEDWTASAKLGRQLNPLGSSRTDPRREAPNAYRAFDGLSFLASNDNWSISAFALRPVALSPGTLDDEPDSTEAFWGVYASRVGLTPQLSLDFNYLGRRDEEVIWAQGAGAETRHSVGVRAYGNSGAASYNLETNYQFGDFEDASIQAWALSGEVSRTFDQDLEIGLRGNVVSGDKDPSDNRLGTFSALYPRFTYYSPAASIAPANAWDTQLFATIRPDPNISLSTAVGLLSKLEDRDAVYRVPYLPLPGTSQVRAGKGAEFGYVSLRWSINRALTLDASFTAIAAQDAIKLVGGRDQYYGMLSTTFSF